MTTVIIFHEVQDGAAWAKESKRGPGSRREMFGKIGATCRAAGRVPACLHAA